MTLQAAGKEDADRAVKAARKSFDDGPWRHMSGSERAKVLRRLASLVEEHRDQLATLEAIDNGKPRTIANGLDVGFTIQVFNYYAEWCDKIHGKTLPIDGPFIQYTRREPVGVAAQIIPWNFPIALASWKLGPALAAGCSVVLKPAEQTPLTALYLGDLAMQAGLPEGVLNILTGYGEVTGEAIATHPLVDKVAFTGSTEVGKMIQGNAGLNNLKHVTLELGGKSPNIIMNDVDMDMAIGQSQFALFFNMGQACNAGSRTFVHESIYDEFVERSAAAAKNSSLGDPLDEQTSQGPQIDKAQADRIMSYIEKGKSEGARLLAGGNRVDRKGFFVEQTVFADVKDDMTIAREDIFGPVMSIMKFSSIPDVIKRANDTNYGLAAAVCTNSLETALHISNELRAGQVYVNCYGMLQTTTPFGGFKDSGIGRELGPDALDNYLDTKTVIIKRPDDSLP